MNMRIFIKLAIVLIVSLLSGCANNGTVSETPPAGGGQSSAGAAAAATGAKGNSLADPSAPPASAVPAETPQQTTQAAQAAQQHPEPSQPPQAAPAKTYKMNPKTYDIVPIEQSGSKKVVLLTFDDGPKDKELLESIIGTLDKHHAKAIFFTNGYRIERNPDLLKLIHDRGQIIGNHAWDHGDLKKMTPAEVDKQLDDVQNIVRELTGQSPVFFRPPFGSGSDYVREKAKQDKLLYMTWSNGSKDWEMSSKSNSPEQVVQNVLDQLHAGSNILMHELSWTAAALDRLLTKLEEKGYSFVDPQTIETPE